MTNCYKIASVTCNICVVFFPSSLCFLFAILLFALGYITDSLGVLNTITPFACFLYTYILRCERKTIVVVCRNRRRADALSFLKPIACAHNTHTQLGYKCSIPIKPHSSALIRFTCFCIWCFYCDK